MSHAIRFHAPGGPEVLRWEELDVPLPGPGEIQVRHGAIGLNFIDVYHRTGLYPLPLPSGLGLEGAGTVTAVGPDVTEFAPDDRIAYANPPVGAYSQVRNLPAHRAIRIPDRIDERTAAAMMLSGLTAQYLLRRTCRVESGDTVLIHAAAGAVGLIACQWARALGATVIGTVGSDQKADIARAHGCHHPVIYTRENFAERVKEITDGHGVRVVYDSIGKDTFDDSLDCLQPLGMMVTYGNASGPVEPMQPAILAAKGSLFLTRPTLMTYTAKREDMLAMADELFEVVTSGKVSIEINQTYPLAEAAQAHRDLEARKTTGSTVLLP